MSNPTLTIADVILAARKKRTSLLSTRKDIGERMEALQGSVAQDAQAQAQALRSQRRQNDQEIGAVDLEIAELERTKAEDDLVDAKQREVHPVISRGLIGNARTESGSWIDRSTGARADLEPGQSFRSHAVVEAAATRQAARDQAVVGTHGNLDTFIRALSTTGQSAVIPTVWGADIIDRARNHAAVLQAGAQIVPMAAKTVQIGRLTGDPTASFRTEGATIAATDATFDNVTLTATTMSALTVMSLEFWQDSIDSAEGLITEAIAQQFALTLDLVALYGSITSGSGTINLPTPPNPRGVLGALLAIAPTAVLPSSGAATNGTSQTTGQFWNEVLDAIYTVRDANEMPNAMLWSSKLARRYAKTYDSMGQPLRHPADVDALEQYVTNQIPSYTQGTLNTATDLFVGDWTKLIIGQRMELEVQVLTEAFAVNGQIGIVCNWRGDVQPARAKAFSVYRALQGA